MRIIPRTVIQVVALLLFGTAPGCDKGELVTFSRPMMGTMVSLTVIADTRESGVRASEAAFGEIARIEALMSPKSVDSDIARLNREAARSPVSVSEETFSLLRTSIEVSLETGGAFDVSFASLGGLWKLGSEDFRPPDARMVTRMLPLVDYRKIRLETEGRRVSLALPGMRLGLGGIAKGYAIGRAVQVLRREGVRASIVDAGGDLQVTGDRFGEPWRVGLMHPRKKEIILAFSVRDGEAVVTSGDYERFALHNGIRYHHILDPKTGFPARGLSSVTVTGSDPVMADAYATALFVMGGVRAREFARANPRIEVIFIDEELRIAASKGLKGRISSTGSEKIEWF